MGRKARGGKRNEFLLKAPRGRFGSDKIAAAYKFIMRVKPQKNPRVGGDFLSRRCYRQDGSDPVPVLI
jgi:hypothetical protein